MVNETENRNRILEMCKFRFRLVQWIDRRSIEHSYACFSAVFKAESSLNMVLMSAKRCRMFPAGKRSNGIRQQTTACSYKPTVFYNTGTYREVHPSTDCRALPLIGAVTCWSEVRGNINRTAQLRSIV